MSIKRNWTRRIEQRTAELAAERPMTPTEIEHAERRAAAPDLGADAIVIDMYGWARDKGRDANLPDTRTYVGLTHMNINSRGMARGEQASLPRTLRRAS